MSIHLFRACGPLWVLDYSKNSYPAASSVGGTAIPHIGMLSVILKIIRPFHPYLHVMVGGANLANFGNS